MVFYWQADSYGFLRVGIEFIACVRQSVFGQGMNSQRRYAEMIVSINDFIIFPFYFWICK